MLTVRPIAIGNKQDILHLIEQVNRKDGLDYSLTEEWFEHIVNQAGNHGLFVAELLDGTGEQRRGKVYGLGTCIVDPTDSGISDVLILVHPDHRRGGLGSALYERILEFCAEKQIDQMQAVVRQRLQHSLDFLEKREFIPQIYSWRLEFDLVARELGNTFPTLDQLQSRIRRATADDFDTYRQLMEECFAHVIEHQHFSHIFADPSIELFFLEELDSPHHRIIGMISLQIRESLNMVYLYDIAVGIDKRRQGFASAMIASILEYIQHIGIAKAVLIVDGKNRKAVSMYEKLGFRETDKEILMEKRL